MGSNGPLDPEVWEHPVREWCGSASTQKYVDDVLLVSALLTIRSRWDGGKIRHSSEWEDEDITTGKTQL